MAPRRAPTILDVAAAAGVSKSTAARALTGAQDIHSTTRSEVLLAAKRLGYERNLIARGMRSGRSGMIGLVIPDLANAFWAELARGAQDAATEAGLSLLLFSSDWNAEREAAHLRALRQTRVDGAILNPVSDADAAHHLTMPCVMIGSTAERYPAFASVGSDIAQGVELGLSALFAAGHRQPALILGPRSRLARARFQRAVHDFCLARDTDPATLSIEESDYTTEGGAEAMRRLLARPDGPPSAVFCANDMIALGALKALRAAGKRVPEEVSVLGFDGIAAGGLMWPPLSTVRKPAREIGIHALQELLARIEGKTADTRLLLPCCLISGGTLGQI